MKGLVIKNTGSWYQVKTDDGQFIECKIKGNFRLKGIRSTNPVAVGDRVQIILNQEGTAFINEIEDRKNYIIRRSSNLSKQSHILAANLDQCMLVVTVNYPETSTIFIDRFLASAEAYRVPVKLVFNKVDAYNEDELRYLDALINLYTHIGYPCFKVSAKEGTGVDAIKKDGKIQLSIKNISENPLNFQADELTERFIRGEVSRSTAGSGLGLSIAKNLTVLQHGSFNIYLDGDLFKVTITFDEAVKEKKPMPPMIVPEAVQEEAQQDA